MGARNRILVIDVGNTRTSFGWLEGRVLVHRKDVRTYSPSSHIWKLLKSGGRRVNLVIMCSVVPRYGMIVKMQVRRFLVHRRILMLGDELKPSFKTTYRGRRTLGSDRIANICYALERYRAGVLIFDFGTALTCDWVDRRGRYRGGVIVPGMGTALRAVCRDAALLPDVGLPAGVRVRLPGRSTASSLQAGAVVGYASLVEGLIGRFEVLQGGRLKVILTGGEGAPVRKWLRHPFVYDPDATLKGILAAYRMSRRAED